MVGEHRARVTLHVAGIHCPSCVDCIEQHLGRLRLPQQSSEHALIRDVSVSILDHTVSFTLEAANQQQDGNDNVQVLKEPLRRIISTLSEEGYAPDALEVRTLPDAKAKRRDDGGTNTRVLPLEAITLHPQGKTTPSSLEAQTKPMAQTHMPPLWDYIVHPIATTREAKRQRQLQARWKRHLEACAACRDAVASGEPVGWEQMQASGSQTGDSAEHADDHDAAAISGPISLQMSIGGMTCSACVGAVERAANATDGVLSCQVNLMTNSANALVRDREAKAALVEAIEDAGYEVEVFKEEQKSDAHDTKTQAKSYKVEFSIDGMTCASCVSNVQRSVESIAVPDNLELANFNINLMQNSATAVIAVKDAQATSGKVRDFASTIASAIEDAGYDATINKVEPIANPLQSGQSKIQARRACVAIEGMFCGECIRKVKKYLQEHITKGEIILSPEQLDGITLARPQFDVTFPSQGTIKLRDLISDLDGLDPAFSARLVKPASPAKQSAQRARRELISLIIRLLVAFLFVPPTLLVAVIAPTFLSTTQPLRQSLETPLVGVAVKGSFILLALATPVQFFVGSLFHTRAIKSLRAVWRRKGAWKDRLFRWGDMNILVSLGTSVAYFASLAFLIVDATSHSPADHTDKSKDSSSMLYFDACVFLVFFILLGRVLEAASKRSTTSAIDALGSLRPSRGLLVEDTASGASREIDIDLLEIGDLVMIPNGSSPPLDAEFVSYAGESQRRDPSRRKNSDTTMTSSDGPAAPTASFSEAAISGESRPIKKQQGEAVYSGTINESSRAVVARVTAPAGECVIDSIVDAVRSAGSSGQKAAVERLADRVTAHFVPAIVFVAIIVLVIWLAILFSGAVSDDWVRRHAGREADQGGSLSGPKVLYALQFAVSCLVIACPCGIGLAAPAAHAVAIGLASRHGILAQGGGQAFEVAVRFALASRKSIWSRIGALLTPKSRRERRSQQGTTLIFDKTGTLTTGASGQVVDHHFSKATDAHLVSTSIARQDILDAVRTIESSTTHPVGVAIAEWCVQQETDSHVSREVQVTDVEELQGRGVRASISIHDGKRSTDLSLHIGSRRLMTELSSSSSSNETILSGEDIALADEWQSSGSSVVYIATSMKDQAPRLFLMLAIADPIREEAPGVIRYLSSDDSSCWVVSGDTEPTTRAIAAKVAIPPSNVVAGVLPAEKAEWVNRIRNMSAANEHDTDIEQQAKGQDRLVAFVGDGINDAPALAAADLSIALGSGSTLAQSSAMFVLMGGNKSSASNQVAKGKIAEEPHAPEAGHRPLAALPVLLSLSRATHAKVWQNLLWACLFNAVCLPIAAGVLVPAGFTLGPSWSGLAMALSSTAVVLNALTLRLWRAPILS